MVEEKDNRWESRVWTGRLLRAVVFLVPVVAAVLVAFLVAKILPRTEEILGVILWWAAIIAVASVTMILVDRLARKALPLALLMQMTMLFPDKAPSRAKMVRLTGSVKRMEERLEAARERDDADMTEAAENVLALAAALNAHDRMTRGHSERVRVFSDLIAEELGLDEGSRDRLRWASLLHDIGKLDVHPDILNKDGRPTEEEWNQLRSHPDYGAELLGPLRPWLAEFAPAVQQHHEKYDGTGYPRGLAGDEISYGARIVSVADSYDAITAARSYKKPISAHVAREELARSAGTHFDPNVVRAFLNISLGQLRWVIGPASWFAQLPFIGGLERIGKDLVLLATTLMVILGMSSAGLIDAPVAAATEQSQGVDASGSETGGQAGGQAGGEPAVVETTTTTTTVTAIAPPEVPEEITTTTAAPLETTTTTLAPTTTTTSPPVTTTTLPPAPTTTLPPMNPPIAVDDVGATSEDVAVTISVLLNDSDPNGDPISIIGASTESEAGGLVSCAGTTCTYTPDTDFNGTDSFTYTIGDGKGGQASATVTVSVAPVNDAPIARDDSASTPTDTSVTISVLSNDSDPEGHQRTITGFSAVSANGGTVACISFCQYLPPVGFTGVDTFMYTITDSQGASSSAVVTISVG